MADDSTPADVPAHRSGSDAVTLQAVSRAGADEDLRHALDTVLREAAHNPKEIRVEAALSYLRARVPANTHARALLQLLIDHLDVYWRGQCTTLSDQGPFELVEAAAFHLRDALDSASLRIARPEGPAELAALADQLGLRADWHEPDEVNVRALTTGLRFNNSGNTSLEQLVILYRDDEPIAQVTLVDLFAWATGPHRTD